jgi:hypothetical protein
MEFARDWALEATLSASPTADWTLLTAPEMMLLVSCADIIVMGSSSNDKI